MIRTESFLDRAREILQQVPRRNLDREELQRIFGNSLVEVTTQLLKNRLISLSELPDWITGADLYCHLFGTASTPANAGVLIGAKKLAVPGVNASPGIATGALALDADTAEQWQKSGRRVILLLPFQTPGDVHGVVASAGIITTEGGPTSHAAVTARQFGRPAVVGCTHIRIDREQRVCLVADLVIHEGDTVSVDGTTGTVFFLPKGTEAKEDLANVPIDAVSWQYSDEVAAIVDACQRAIEQSRLEARGLDLALTALLMRMNTFEHLSEFVTAGDSSAYLTTLLNQAPDLDIVFSIVLQNLSAALEQVTSLTTTTDQNELEVSYQNLKKMLLRLNRVATQSTTQRHVMFYLEHMIKRLDALAQEAYSKGAASRPDAKLQPSWTILRNKHVLIVDDEPYLLQDVIKTLQDANQAEIQIAANTEEAVRVLSSPAAVDLLVCDMMLPMKSILGSDPYQGGLAVCAEARRRRGPDLPILCLTVVTEPEVWLRFQKEGANVRINKPALPSEVVDAIVALLEQADRQPAPDLVAAEIQRRRLELMSADPAMRSRALWAIGQLSKYDSALFEVVDLVARSDTDEAVREAASSITQQAIRSGNTIKESSQTSSPITTQPVLTVKSRPPAAGTPPDLQLLITLSPDGKTLSYTLNSPDGDYNFLPVGSVSLAAPPRELLQRTFDRLSTWARMAPGTRTPAQTAQAIRELADAGSNLYDELFPPEFKREYSALREKHLGGNLLITANEPWIPWEIVRPLEYDHHGKAIYDDPPLCESFKLARWGAGAAAPAQLALDSAVVIQPQANLPAARVEREYFVALPDLLPGLAVAAPLQTVADSLASFSAGQTQLYHLACHGNFILTDPNDSKLELADGFLTPAQLTGDRKSGLLRSRPLVFVNACHAGERGFGLTRLGGWSERFIAAGASAFIGSLWEINDVLAARFAAEFYNRLFGLAGHARLPLAAAFCEARLVLKELDPANPTWLAYVLYGNPRALAHCGASPLLDSATKRVYTVAAETKSTPKNPGLARGTRLAPNYSADGNPFGDVGCITEPERFFDREELLRQVFDRLGKRQNVSLVGESKIGKSSLLSVICALGPDRLGFPSDTFAYLSLQWVETEDDFYEALCEHLRIETCRGYKLTRALRKRQYVLCLDEVEKMVWQGFSAQIRSQLRGLADGPDMPLTLVTASRSSLGDLFPDSPELDSPLSSIFTELAVEPFTPDVAHRFLTERLADTRLTFSEDQIRNLILLSSGHPAKLQEAAASLFREASVCVGKSEQE